MNERLYIMMEKIASRGLVNNIYKKVTSLGKSLEKYNKQHGITRETVLTPKAHAEHVAKRRAIIDEFAKEHGLKFRDYEAGTLADAGFNFREVAEKFLDKLPDAQARSIDAGLQGKILGSKISVERAKMPKLEEMFEVNPFKAGEEIHPAKQRFSDAAGKNPSAVPRIDEINDPQQLRELEGRLRNRRVSHQDYTDLQNSEMLGIREKKRSGRVHEGRAGIYGKGPNATVNAMSAEDTKKAENAANRLYEQNKIKSYRGHKIDNAGSDIPTIEQNRINRYRKANNEFSNVLFMQESALRSKIDDQIAAQRKVTQEAQAKLKAEQLAKDESARLAEEARAKAEADRLAEANKAKALEDANRAKAHTEQMKEEIKKLDAEIDSKFPTGGGGGNSGGGSTGGGGGGIWSGSGKRNTGGSVGDSVGGSTGGSVGGSTSKSSKNYMWPALAGTAAIGGGAYLLHRQSNKDNRDR